MSVLCTATVVSQREVASRHFLLELKAEAVAKKARPGQFVHVRCSDSFDPLLRRPFSLHRILPEGGTIVILYRLAGRGTAWLASRRPGDSVEVMGPLGNGFDLGRGDSSGLTEKADKTSRFPLALLVGGGVGAAPLLALAEALRAQGRKTVAFIGAPSRDQLLQVPAFAAAGAEVVTATDDGSEGCRGTVVAALENWLKSMPASAKDAGEGFRAGAEVFACGPKAMLFSLQQLCLREGLPLQVSLEERMGCGVGACLSCVCRLRSTEKGELKYARVCAEGPVFRGEEVCLNE